MKFIAIAFLAFAAIAGTTTAVVSADVAQKAKSDAQAATKKAAAPQGASHSEGSATAAGHLVSYAGKTGGNTEELAAAHEPFPAELGPVPDGEVVDVELTLKDVVGEIAPA